MTEPYPESAKLLAVSTESQSIGRFLDWLDEVKGWCLAEYADDEPGYIPVNYAPEKLPIEVNYDPEKLLAEYFEIDLAKVEIERRAMLDALRKGPTP